MLSKICLQMIYLIYIKKENLHEITYNGSYAIKPNQTKCYIIAERFLFSIIIFPFIYIIFRFS